MQILMDEDDDVGDGKGQDTSKDCRLFTAVALRLKMAAER